MEKENFSTRQLFFVLFPGQGHSNPMLQLATALHSKGFSNITMAHSEFMFPDPSNHPHLTFVKILDGISHEDQSQGFITYIRNLNKNSVAPLQEILSQMIQDLDEPPCIIYDGFLYQVEDVARSLKLPSLVMRTSNATAFLVYYSLPSLKEEGHIPLQDSKQLDLVPGLEPMRFKELPLPIGNSPFVDSAIQLLATTCNFGSSSGLIYNTIDFLENSSLTQLKKICQVPVFALGPLHKIAQTDRSSGKADTICIEWLDKQASRSVLYVSMGSEALMDKRGLTEMAWGLANSGQPFLWVIRPGCIRGSESEWIESLPEGFKETVGERGCVIKWAPQKEVLAHQAVGGFWTHCGWNSILESLCEGVPMICWPRYGDQKINTRLLTYVWKVAIEVEHTELEREDIERCIKTLMVDKEGIEMRQRAMELKENISLSIAKGGSSYNALNDVIELIKSS